ncbi:MAG: hypothetical protein R3C18_07150 [Planctomycetaceae bacterium]
MRALELFWPIPRNVMQLVDADTQQTRRLRSLVAYQFLFGGKLIIRDSDYLNFLALRRAFLSTPTERSTGDADFFRSAFTDKWIMISCRAEKQLGQTAEGLLGRGGSVRIPDELYCSSAMDIRAIEEQGLIEPRLQFSLSNASQYYTDQITRILDRSLEPHLPDNFREQLSKSLHRKVAESGTVGWEFLSLEGGVWDGVDEQAKQLYGDFIYRVVGQAPHAGFIPDTLGTDPIYMNDVAECINLWRGRKPAERQQVESRTFELGKGFSLSDYVECLSCLSLDAIQDLFASDEGEQFRKASVGYARQKMTFAELETAYRDYRKRIDERILQCMTYRQSGGKVALDAFKAEIIEEGTSEVVNVVIDEVIGNSIPFWKLGYSTYLWLRYGEWPKQQAERLAFEKSSKSAAALIQDIQENPDRIDSEIVSGSGTHVDRPVEMNWELKRDVCVDDVVN